MPRKRRFFLPDVPAHVVQRGHNRQPVFFAEGDRLAYLKWAKEAASRYRCAIHAYVLMNNHVHLLVTPSDAEAISRLMQYVGRRYVPHINRRYGRSGTLWEGRFKASIIETQSYLLACYRYIELNPIRAGIVTAPEDYRWSSYRCNAFGERDEFLTAHAEYLALGRTDSERCGAYRGLFGASEDLAVRERLRVCLRSGTPVGEGAFCAEVERALGRRVGQVARGHLKRALTPF
ncbi:transposase [Thioflavicoccus mobilis 8321]|uniref:Transposase n=1 Tax=Thioflavicoccus mobilis 8321 TaxID=765912 RepID=L0GSN8_9GAMM|nr:transposase [Thioflavicoccus mobilis]AGA89783.1 transposase [Thioflavicoccus mobilis 8321]